MPVVANDKIYIQTNAGMVHVVQASPTCQLIASNDMTFDDSGFGDTPAVSDGNLLPAIKHAFVLRRRGRVALVPRLVSR